MSVSRPSLCSGSWMVLVGKYFKPLSRDGTKLYLTCLFLQWEDLKDRWGKWKFGAWKCISEILYFLLQLLGCVCCCTWINWATTENSLRFSFANGKRVPIPKLPWRLCADITLEVSMSERKLFLYFTLSSWKLRKMLTNQNISRLWAWWSVKADLYSILLIYTLLYNYSSVWKENMERHDLSSLQANLFVVHIVILTINSLLKGKHWIIFTYLLKKKLSS